MQEINPLLEKLKLPGRIFQLPSRGYLYTNGELSTIVKDAEVHVHPLSALDEISLKNPDLLFSGKAADSVFKTCIPELNSPLELFGKDIDAIMLFLRVVSYGPIYNLETTHSCKDAKSHEYQINVEEFISKIGYLDPTTIESQYTVTLPNNQIVRLQPLRYKHIIEIYQMNENKKEMNADDIKKNLTTNLLNLIHSVDGVIDRNFITEWIRKLPTGYVSKIAHSVENSSKSWGANLETKIKCADCGQEFDVEIPINPISFFTE